jgi:hypothetical protein
MYNKRVALMWRSFHHLVHEFCRPGWRPIVKVACMASLRTFLGGNQVPTHAMPNITSTRARALQRWRSNVYDGQWCEGPIPKLTQFSYWNKKCEVRVSPGRSLHCQVENHVQRKKIYILHKGSPK